MVILKNFIEIIFSASLFINALLFVPQIIKLLKDKKASGVSLITFLGFFLIQFAIVLHGMINQDYLLSVGYIFSMLTCGTVIFLILYYRKKSVSKTQKQNW